MTTKLYHHKTDGGAEYLTDTFIAWKHNGKSGREGIVTHDTKICIRLDGKYPEVLRFTAPAAFVFVSGGAVTEIVNEHGEDITGAIHVIDWDSAEGGACPVCGTELTYPTEDADGMDELNYTSTCPNCGLNADTDDNTAALRAWKKAESE